MIQDAMEKVLLEAGVGGSIALQDYYQSFILRFDKKLKGEVEAMAEEQRHWQKHFAELSCNSKYVFIVLQQLLRRFCGFYSKFDKIP